MQEKVSHHASVYDLFILVFTVLSIVVAVLTFQDGVTSAQQRTLWQLDFLLSMVLMGDFLIRGWNSADKRAYLRENWGDFLGSLPAIPALRIFRLFRIWRLIRILRRTNIKRWWYQVVRKRAESSLWAMIILVVIAVLVSGLWILRLEQTACDMDAAANICTLEDGMWWAFVTVTTVGYGDHFPVSESGRLMAAVLMTLGVGLFGIFTSYLASVFLEVDEQARDAELEAIRAELVEIKALLQQQMGESKKR